MQNQQIDVGTNRLVGTHLQGKHILVLCVTLLHGADLVGLNLDTKRLAGLIAGKTQLGVGKKVETGIGQLPVTGFILNVVHIQLRLFHGSNSHHAGRFAVEPAFADRNLVNGIFSDTVEFQRLIAAVTEIQQRLIILLILFAIILAAGQKQAHTAKRQEYRFDLFHILSFLNLLPTVILRQQTVSIQIPLHEREEIMIVLEHAGRILRALPIFIGCHIGT